MTDVNTVANRYIDLWNERTPSRRRELLAANWTHDAKYVDPLMSGDGHDGVDARWVLRREVECPPAAEADDGEVEGDARRRSREHGPTVSDDSLGIIATRTLARLQCASNVMPRRGPP